MYVQPDGRAKYFKFLLYALVVVLINIAGLTLFFRIDLTHNKMYSLSPISKRVAATLTEPLTVKVFFSRDLPAPYNTNELYIRDLLKEYALNNPRHFKVDFYDVSSDSRATNSHAVTNQQMARDYGIHPVQIQIVEQDELKFRQAYMGLVLIHGDIVERIPTIASTDGLEYQLTTAIQKLNHKVSALLALEEPITVTLALSSNMYKIASMIAIQDLERYADQVKTVVDGLSARTYGKLEFDRIDPSLDPTAAAKVKKAGLKYFMWRDVPEANLKADEGVVGLLLQYKGKVREIPLLNMVRLPLFGDQYQLVEIEQIEGLINNHIERLIDINEALGYLADFGTPDLGGGHFAPQGEALNQFSALVNQTYNITPIELKQNPIPDGLQTLIIARPTEPFSDYDLFRIDQALMRGTNLAVFIDAFELRHMQQQPFMAQQMPMHVPLDTGLEQLLAHYGVRIDKSLLMDEKSYRQRLPQQQGGGEQPIYFAPIIENERINKELPYLQNIKGLLALEISPLELIEARVDEQQITAHKLFESSARSWLMRDQIILNPMFIQPPASDSDMGSRPLAYLLKGSFTSYFKDRPMPEKAVVEESDLSEESQSIDEPASRQAEPNAAADLSPIDGRMALRETSAPAKVLVMASSKMISDQLLEASGQNPNSMFVLNMIDALNGREDVAVMRAKVQRFNPLEPTGPGKKAMIKTFNMAGLPFLVVIFGLIVWWHRHTRRMNIQRRFLIPDMESK
jgi:ABC-2 type transport system permease protein